MADQTGMWDEEVDLLVIGSGAAGMTAALVAALEGLNVLLCEKAATFGGTSATSGGAIWIAGSSQAKRAGHTDSIEKGQEYLRNELGTYAREDLIRAFTTSGPEAVDYLEERSNVIFDVGQLPDYHAETPGGVAAGRVLMAKPFDGRLLGKHFAQLGTPKKWHMLLGGMMVGRADIPLMLAPFASWRALRYVTGRLLRYAADLTRYPRGTWLLNGNAMMARLLKSLLTAGVEMRTATWLSKLLESGGRVEGALVESNGIFRRIKARRGVVLATGGCARPSQIHRDLTKEFPHEHTLAHEGSTGDGIRAGLEAGGVIDRHVATPGLWTAASIMNEKDGTITVADYGMFDRGKPGAIAVDKSGARFVNEADSYHDVVQAMYRNAPSGTVPRAYLVCDSHFIKRYGLALIRPHDLKLRSYVRAGYVVRAGTLHDLAVRLGVDANRLIATVAKHNEYAVTGIDLDFRKGTTIYNRSNGDLAVKPNHNLKALEKPPFYALPVTPATFGTSIGLKTNENAQVLAADGLPILGLYAVGTDMTSVMRGLCPGGGIALGPALVFAYRAALNAAKSSGRESRTCK